MNPYYLDLFIEKLIELENILKVMRYSNSNIPKTDDQFIYLENSSNFLSKSCRSLHLMIKDVMENEYPQESKIIYAPGNERKHIAQKVKKFLRKKEMTCE